MKATHIYTEKFNTPRKLANRALKAMTDICEYDNGTLRNPFELASTRLNDGRTIIQTIYEDRYVSYNDGYFVVEVEEDWMYVDVTGKYLREISNDNYNFIYDEGLEPILV